jgi:hypothetical protein
MNSLSIPSVYSRGDSNSPVKIVETQVNKIDEVKTSLVDITRKVSSLEITVKEIKEKNKDIYDQRRLHN